MERDPLQAREDAPAAPRARALVMLRLGPSRRAGFILAVMHLGAMACLTTLAWPGPWVAGAGAVVAWSLLRACRLHASRAAAVSVTGLRALADGRWQLETHAGERVEVRPADRPCVFRSLVTVRFRDASGRSWPVVIVPDMVDREGFRRLRVFLRVCSGASSTSFPDR